MSDIINEQGRPEGLSLDAFKVELNADETSFKLVAPVKLTWVRELQQPELIEGRDGAEEKKWSVAAAIPKVGSDKLLAAIKAASDTIAKNAGVKGPYPHFLRDGAATDSAGMFVKQDGRLQNYHYFTAKTKRAPVVKTQGSDGFLPCDLEDIYSGGYALLSCNVIMVTYGGSAGGKKGTSAWLNRLLWVGGGTNLGGGSGGSEVDDFGDLLPSGGGESAENFL